LRTLLERFGNNTSTGHTNSVVDRLYDDANKDEELKNRFKQINQYACEVL